VSYGTLSIQDPDTGQTIASLSSTVSTDPAGNPVPQGLSASTGSVDGQILQDGTVGSDQLGAAVVVAEKLATGAVTAEALAEASVTAIALAGDAVTVDALADGAVTNAKIGDTAVDANKLADGSVSAAKVIAGAIDSSKLSSDVATELSTAAANASTAIAAAAAAQSAADEAQATADGAIRTYYQADPPAGLNATTDLGDLWFDTDTNQAYRWNGTDWTLIEDNTIAQALAAAQTAQTTADGKIVSYWQSAAPTGAATGDLWYDTGHGNRVSWWTGSAWQLVQMGTDAIQVDAITANLISAGAVGTAELAANSVIAGKIAAGAVEATALAAGSVTADKLVAGAVTADALAAGAIVSGKIAAGAIDAMEITGATVVTDSATGGVFVYDGDPTLGNLIVSIASMAGTDDFGNSYPKGVDVNQGTIAGSLISIEPGPNNGIFVYGTVPTVTTFNSGSGNWVCPAGVTSVKVEVWGAGGAGGGYTSAGGGGGGGGGGEYAAEPAIAVTPGNSYAYTVGAGGTAVAGGNGGNGGDTDFGGGLVGGFGGDGGAVNGFGGSGAAGGGSTADFNGGSGGTQAFTGGGGGGGGSGGYSADGNDGADAVSATKGGAGAAAVTGGGPGGNGGTSTLAGTTPAAPGGGGGGAGSKGTAGRGANGRVTITYTPARTLLASIAGAPGTDPYGNTYSAGISGVIGAGLFAAKSADESVTASTTLQNDDHLVVPVAANATYTIDGYLQWIGNDTGDIKFAFAFPSGSTLHWGMIGPDDLATTFASLGTRGTSEWFARTSQTTSSAFIQYSASTAALLGRMSGLLVTGGSAGTLTLQWAQFVSNPTATTLKQGSWLKLSRVA
jgi:hypothetical protein